jgi:hypothetical protein
VVNGDSLPKSGWARSFSLRRMCVSEVVWSPTKR